MKYINSKTITLALSAFAIVAFTGCDSKTGAPSDSQLVGSPTPPPVVTPPPIVTPPPAGQKAPVAVAGPDRTIVEGDSFTLDGKESYDSDGEIISYVWSGDGLSKEGITVDFDSVPYRAEPYIITLTVTDNDGNTNSDTVEITVIAEDADNLPPEAKASISPKTSYNCSEDTDWDINIALDASLSSDPEGEALTFAWSGTMGDDKESIKTLISNKDSVIASILVKDLCNQCVQPTSEDPSGSKICDIIFNVDVTDIGALSDNAQVTASVMWEHNPPPAENLPPVADAGSAQTIGICDALVMDGTSSNDPDGNIVKYVWTVADGAIELGTGPTPTLTMAGRTPGEHTITLTVTDDDGATATDTVTVTITGENDDYDYTYIIRNPYDGDPVNKAVGTGASVYQAVGFTAWIINTRPSNGLSGTVNLHFSFPGNVTIAHLNTSVYAKYAYSSGKHTIGTATLNVSSDQTTWEELLKAGPPTFNNVIVKTYNDFLNETVLNTPDIWIQAVLERNNALLTGSSRFLNAEPTDSDAVTFKLNVCHEGTVPPS